jgi:hypothetical protein
MKIEKEETVFILGAGASVPYGFPTSNVLRKDLIDNFANKFSSVYKMKSRPDNFMLNTRLEEIKEFQKRFDLSSIFSIDYFMSRNPRYMEYGMDAIIIHLLEYERESKFRESSILKNSDWYSYLYNYMISELRSPDSFSKIADNNFTFLTFNYERSLEKFLAESISYSFEGITWQQLKQVMLNIPIHHIYGKISSIPFHKDEEGLNYGEEINFASLPKLRENIRTICDNNSVETKVEEIIKKAKRIFFLGFGYDRINLSNIGIPALLNNGQKIYGTVFNKNERFIRDLKEYLINGNLLSQSMQLNKKPVPMNERNFIFENIDSLILLQKYL